LLLFCAFATIRLDFRVAAVQFQSTVPGIRRFHNVRHKKSRHSRLRSPSRISVTKRHRTSTSLDSAAAFVDIGAFLEDVENFYKGSPYTSAFLTCGVKASAADIIVQSQQSKQRKQSYLAGTVKSEFDADEKSFMKELDLRQNFAFTLYGGLYQGVFLEHMFNRVFPIWFGRGSKHQQIVSKVLFILLIFTPLLTLPCAYITKAIVFRYSLREALLQYWDDAINHALLKKYWTLWGPVNYFAFAVVPEHLRITFMAVVSFFWMIILSSIANRVKDTD